jgi:inosose dehydratase
MMLPEERHKQGWYSMTRIRVANAPCSWGILEFSGLERDRISSSQMLDEMRATGYEGTEFGDWGHLPTEPEQLGELLEQHQLTMVGAFVPVAFRFAEGLASAEQEVLRLARLLAAVATEEHTPLLILADENGTDSRRTGNAGRVTPEMGLTADEWKHFARNVEQLARLIRDETGLEAAFHHHCAGFVETPAEIERLLELTAPELVGLVFDTGHYLYGSGTNDGQVVSDGFARLLPRIRHVHLKDCHPGVAAQARTAGWDYFTALAQGVFCELGQGAVPFADIVQQMRESAYAGWIVVEQDILPGATEEPRESARRNRDYLRTLGL